MPYDEDLANRIREQLADEEGVSEQRMFGGLVFLVHGHISVAASRTGGLLARIDPAENDAALARAGVTPMEMRGRTMAGWLTVAPEAVRTAAELGEWVGRSVAFARSLPAKQPRRARR